MFWLRIALGDPGRAILSVSSAQRTLMKSWTQCQPEVFIDLYSLYLTSSNLDSFQFGLNSLRASPQRQSTTVGMPLMQKEEEANYLLNSCCSTSTGLLFTITCILLTLLNYLWIVTFWMFLMGFKVALLSARVFCCTAKTCETYLGTYFWDYLLPSDNKFAFPFQIAYRIFKIFAFSFFQGGCDLEAIWFFWPLLLSKQGCINSLISSLYFFLRLNLSTLPTISQFKSKKYLTSPMLFTPIFSLLKLVIMHLSAMYLEKSMSLCSQFYMNSRLTEPYHLSSEVGTYSNKRQFSPVSQHALQSFIRQSCLRDARSWAFSRFLSFLGIFLRTRCFGAFQSRMNPKGQQFSIAMIGPFHIPLQNNCNKVQSNQLAITARTFIFRHQFLIL